MITTGFGQGREREFALWDARQLSVALRRERFDVASAALMPLYDEDTGLLFLAGRGEGSIRWFETVESDPYFYEGASLYYLVALGLILPLQRITSNRKLAKSL